MQYSHEIWRRGGERLSFFAACKVLVIVKHEMGWLL